MMLAQRREAPVAETEREGLVERRRFAAPGQKLIVVATSTLASALILLGILSKNNYFGVFGAAATAKPPALGAGRTVTPPDLRVPLSLGSSPAQAGVTAPAHVECEGGLRLPLGMTCPPAQQPGATPAPDARPGTSEEDRVRERRLKGGIGLSAGSANAPGKSEATVLAGERASPMSATPVGGTNALGGGLAATLTPSTRASIHRRPSMTLAKGTLPDCTLLTAINTEQPGFLKCLLSSPVMSMDGKVVLMEAGTTMEGEYTQGLLAGQSSIFTLWTRAVTPHFVTVELASPGTDALGRAGSSGQVDAKWFERFAGAVFFSLFEDAKQIYLAGEDARAARRAGSGTGNTYNFGSQRALSQLDHTGGTTGAIVEEMLKQGSQVRPSLHKHQGEIIKIFVARDVDFSGVYDLRPVRRLEQGG